MKNKTNEIIQVFFKVFIRFFLNFFKIQAFFHVTFPRNLIKENRKKIETISI